MGLARGPQLPPPLRKQLRDPRLSPAWLMKERAWGRAQLSFEALIRHVVGSGWTSARRSVNPTTWETAEFPLQPEFSTSRSTLGQAPGRTERLRPALQPPQATRLACPEQARSRRCDHGQWGASGIPDRPRCGLLLRLLVWEKRVLSPRPAAEGSNFDQTPGTGWLSGCFLRRGRAASEGPKPVFSLGIRCMACHVGGHCSSRKPLASGGLIALQEIGRVGHLSTWQCSSASL